MGGGPKREERILGCLGILRRMGALVPGQDRVERALRSSGNWLVFFAEDTNGAVLRRLGALAARQGATIRPLKGIDRRLLGERLGLRPVQVLALPADEPLAERLSGWCDEGSDVHEQNQGV